MSFETILADMKKSTAIFDALSDDMDSAARITGEPRMVFAMVAEKLVDKFLAEGMSLSRAIDKTKEGLQVMIREMPKQRTSEDTAKARDNNSLIRFTHTEISEAARTAAQSCGYFNSNEVINSIIRTGRPVDNGCYEFDGWSAYNQSKKHAHEGTAEREALGKMGSSPEALLAKAVASAKADLQRQRADHHWVANSKAMNAQHKHFSQTTAAQSDRDISLLEQSMNIKVTKPSSGSVPAAHQPYRGNSVQGALSYAIEQQHHGRAGNGFAHAVQHLQSVGNIVVTGSSHGGRGGGGGGGGSGGGGSGGSGMSNVVIY
eukprot:gene42124-51438_t